MARKKRVGEIGTTGIVLIGVGVLAIGYFLMQKPPVPTTIIRTQPSTGSGLTAAEIAAGATVADTLINDLTGSDDSNS
jgi:hypothetical protein